MNVTLSIRSTSRPESERKYILWVVQQNICSHKDEKTILL